MVSDRDFTMLDMHKKESDGCWYLLGKSIVVPELPEVPKCVRGDCQVWKIF